MMKLIAQNTIRDGGSTALSTVCTASCKNAIMPIYAMAIAIAIAIDGYATRRKILLLG